MSGRLLAECHGGVADRDRYGVMLIKEKNDEEARRWLIRSVRLYPFNWGAWQELASLVGSVEDVGSYIQTTLTSVLLLM